MKGFLAGPEPLGGAGIQLSKKKDHARTIFDLDAKILGLWRKFHKEAARLESAPQPWASILICPPCRA